MLNSIAALTKSHLPLLLFSYRSVFGFLRALDFPFVHSPGVTIDVHYLDIDSLDNSVQQKGETGFRLWKLILVIQLYLALSSHQDTGPAKK